MSDTPTNPAPQTVKHGAAKLVTKRTAKVPSIQPNGLEKHPRVPATRGEGAERGVRC